MDPAILLDYETLAKEALIAFGYLSPDGRRERPPRLPHGLSSERVLESPTSIPEASRTPSLVSRPDRERLLGQRGLFAWLTGLLGSGNTVLVRGAERVLFSRGRLVRRVDADDLHAGLNRGLCESMDDRRESVRRIAELARVLVDAGIVVLVSAISPTNENRAERTAETLAESRTL